MESEKVKEIKKALEDNANCEHYNSLWYMEDCKCITVAYADILTLINELERENERLNKELDSEWKDRRKAEENLHKAQWHYKIGLSQSQKRNKELKDRLAELEDEIENGTLRKAPCKVGDTIYFDTYSRGDSIGIQPHKVVRVQFVVHTEGMSGNFGTDIQEYEFDKSVFFTAEEAEAEARLKELQEKQK